jgi:hypothetical protein
VQWLNVEGKPVSGDAKHSLTHNATVHMRDRGRGGGRTGGEEDRCDQCGEKRFDMSLRAECWCAIQANRYDKGLELMATQSAPPPLLQPPAQQSQSVLPQSVPPPSVLPPPPLPQPPMQQSQPVPPPQPPQQPSVHLHRRRVLTRTNTGHTWQR